MVAGSLARFEMGRVFERAFGVMGANFGVFAVLAVLLGALPTAVLEAVQYYALGIGLNGQASPNMFTPNTVVISLVTGLVSLCFTYALQGAVTRGAVVSLNGGKATLNDCITTGVQVLLPAIGIALLAGLGEMIGFILLIVPGVILMLAWVVAIPVRVMERRGVVAALTRSAELTRGHRWSLFGMFVVLAIVYWLFVMALGLVVSGAVTAASPNNVAVASLIASPIISAVASIVSSAFVASIYYELRTIKEGVGSDTLAAVFD